MSLNIRSYQRPRVNLNLSALVDVILILFVFVTLAANFEETTALDIQLPGSHAAPEKRPGALTVELDSSGNIAIDGERVSGNQVIARLRALRSQYRHVRIVADASLPLAKATEMLEIVNTSGYEAASIATQKHREN